jgi:hypothetical protein
VYGERTPVAEGRARKPGAGRGRSRLTYRNSAFTWLILGLCALQLVCLVLSMVLPWGTDSAGNDIRNGTAGLLPWFLLVPVLFQLGFLAVGGRFLQVFYVVCGLVTAGFIIIVHYLTYLRYGSGFGAGFYALLFGAGASAVNCMVCLVERRAFPRLRARGRASIAGAGGGGGRRGK